MTQQPFTWARSKTLVLPLSSVLSSLCHPPPAPIYLNILKVIRWYCPLIGTCRPTIKSMTALAGGELAGSLSIARAGRQHLVCLWTGRDSAKVFCSNPLSFHEAIKQNDLTSLHPGPGIALGLPSKEWEASRTSSLLTCLTYTHFVRIWCVQLFLGWRQQFCSKMQLKCDLALGTLSPWCPDIHKP